MLKIKSLILFLLVLSFLSSCKKDDNPNLDANKDLLETMNDFYLWYDKMTSVNSDNYPSPIELLEVLRYKELDRWSYITTKQELNAYYEEGQFVGFGIGLAFDTNNQLWISFIFNDSPLRTYGVERGWRIAAIDGIVPTPSNVNNLFGPSTAGITIAFTMINLEGETVYLSATKRVVSMNTVLLDTTYSTNAGQVGYLVLKGFIDPTVDELNVAFNKFLSQDVNELIVDLRYNTGGAISSASHLANLIAGNIANNEILGNYVHNDKQSHRDKAIYISIKANSLPISRVVFITTGQSASASELVINGLIPHMDLTLVGSQTYGKPVGMYGFTSKDYDWAFVPICFKILNANNEGDYYNGIPVDIEQIDGINYPFGDLNEPSLNTALAFIGGGVPKYGLPTSPYRIKYPIMKGLQSEIGAW
jgi:C-terminal processing protease CtpA/Prc